MMLQPFTTTWPLLAQATAEGACFLKTDQGLFFAAHPKRVLKTAATSDSWQQLQAFINSCERPAIGYISYEMGAVAQSYWLPSHPSCYPALVFYEPETFIQIPELPMLHASFNLPLIERSDTKQTYCQKVEAVKELIAAGDVYQVNLSQSFTFARQQVDPLELFLALYTKNPASYACYLNVGDFAICSLSPELFVKKLGATLYSCPIKGTAPRSSDTAMDEKLKNRLLGSIKEQAELLMITDLIRNDLQKICTQVTTKQIGQLQTLRDVFHLVSRVEGQLQQNLDSVEIIQEIFPAGSITGCPKKAAIEAIAAIEQRARGIYTGAIGIFYPTGDFAFNVAIRTLTMDTNKIILQTGGGVVYDSIAEKEYEETIYKGRTFFEVLCQQPTLMENLSL